MARRLVIGSTVTFTPSEGSAEDYNYTLSDMDVASMDAATGVLTALNPGQVSVLVERASDGITIGRFVFQVLSEADANAEEPLPTFEAQIVPPEPPPAPF